MNPLVSIVIPIFNRSHLIAETLDSILAQTYKNWECIIVDDGSTDDTAEKVAVYCKRDDRFQYHLRPKNKIKGANSCRNYGFKISKGEYINWFDSDDLMMPKKLEIQLSELHNSGFDYSICQTLMVDVIKNKEIGLRAPKLKSDNVFEDYIKFKIFWLTGAPMWKKTFLKNHNLIFDESLQQAQDYDFHMRVLSVSENYMANETALVQFKIHQDNMSKSILDHHVKTFSNIRVKYKTLSNYKESLSYEVRTDIFKEFKQLYSFVIRKRYKMIALKSSFLLLSLWSNNKELFQSNICKMLYRTFTPLSYTFFGRGFKLTKLVNSI